jgi:lipoprotein-releasing system permease protein
MFRPLPVFVGLRYTRAKRRNHFISFISLASLLGIALGITALITVISVMNGFERELRERILGMTAHVTVTAVDRPLERWEALAARLADQPQVAGVAPYAEGQGMLTSGPFVQGVVVRGVLPAREPAVSDVGAHMEEGALAELEPGGYGLLLGRDLAFALGVGVGDRVTLVTPQATVTPAGILPRLKRFTVVGIFRVGMYEYDSATALVHIQDAARLFRLGEGVSGLRLRLEDMFQAPRVSAQVADTLSADYRVDDWTRQHASFFGAIRTEKTVMFVILTLIVAVAAFNIIATLVMVVTDKESDIAILRTLGATPGRVMTVFIVQGAVIGLAGTLLGVLGGVTLALNVETVVPALEQLFGFKILSPDIYYISDLPSDLRRADVGRIAVVALVLSLIATLYPAWRAARVHPAQSLRYE